MSDAPLLAATESAPASGKRAVDALCTHPDIAAVSFVGSTAVGTHVYNLASQQGKRVQCMMGDGGVRFVTNSIDLTVWRAVGSRANGEIASLEN